MAHQGTVFMAQVGGVGVSIEPWVPRVTRAMGEELTELSGSNLLTLHVASERPRADRLSPAHSTRLTPDSPRDRRGPAGGLPSTG